MAGWSSKKQDSGKVSHFQPKKKITVKQEEHHTNDPDEAQKTQDFAESRKEKHAENEVAEDN